MVAKRWNEAQHLLSSSHPWTRMADLNTAQPAAHTAAPAESHRYSDELRRGISTTDSSPHASTGAFENHVEYKVYKRRWFGLGQLVLLNIILSWGVRFQHWTLAWQMDG